jgi:hypothetical protein
LPRFKTGAILQYLQQPTTKGEAMKNFQEFGPTKTRDEVSKLAKDAIKKDIFAGNVTICFRCVGDDGFVNVGEVEGDWFAMAVKNV